MNVVYRLLLQGAGVLLVCGLSFTAQRVLGQSNNSPYKKIETSRNVAVKDTLSGLNMVINKTNPLPKHGTLDIKLIMPGGSGTPSLHEIKYTPHAGFVGVDSFVVEINYINSYPFLVYQAYQVHILPSKLTARNDYAVSNGGTMVNIQVLGNDQSSVNGLYLQSLPLVVNGTATFNAEGEIEFEPTAGYTGTAHLSYVVCDVLDHCKTSFVNIGVNDGKPAKSDTLQLVTAKNNPQSMPLLYEGYSVFQAPVNGMVSLTNGMAFHYIPNTDFQGNDEFILAKTNPNGHTVYKTVRVNVVNTAATNRMAMDDVAFTPRNKSISFNVRANDIGNLSVSSWVPPAASVGTISNASNNGTVTFTPNPNFSGIATFRYRVGNQFVPDLEMATVQVYVSNQNPAEPVFDLTTPVGTPYVLNYRIPIKGFTFSVLNGPEHGTCQVFPGYTTQNINGQSISGESLVVYTPNNNYEGADEITLRYCVNANGQCDTVKMRLQVVPISAYPGPYCLSDCAWPGDVNRDGLVNNQDILPLGYAMGQNGEARLEAFPADWFGQASNDWNDPFLRLSADLKHQDTNGDGQVSIHDTASVYTFYGKTHQMRPRAMAGGKGLPFKLVSSNPNPQIGDVVRIEVSLGNAVKPMMNVYGFTFDMTLSPNIVDSNLHIKYLNNTWLNQNAPSFWLSKTPRRGRLESAFTRANGVTTNGGGVFGVAEFIIIDVVWGGRPGLGGIEADELEVAILNPTLHYTDGSSEQYEPVSLRLPLRQTTPQAFPALLAYPNPGQDWVNLQLADHQHITQVNVFDASGRMVFQASEIATDRYPLNISQWANGFYFVQAYTASGVVQGKFLKKLSNF